MYTIKNPLTFYRNSDYGNVLVPQDDISDNDEFVSKDLAIELLEKLKYAKQKLIECGNVRCLMIIDKTINNAENI